MSKTFPTNIFGCFSAEKGDYFRNNADYLKDEDDYLKNERLHLSAKTVQSKNERLFMVADFALGAN
jgi:hypothetical protein